MLLCAMSFFLSCNKEFIKWEELKVDKTWGVMMVE